MFKIRWSPIQVLTEICNELIKLWSKEVEVLIYEKETKEIRTKIQNNMFHWLFWEISKHLWIHREDIKQSFLKWVFGTRKVKLWRLEFENAIKPHTSELTKEEAIFFIENIKIFIEKYWVPCKYTNLDFENLISTY